MKILHVNYSDISGGAARAAYRIHRSLLVHGSLHGLESQLRVISRLSDDTTVICGAPLGQGLMWRRLRPFLTRQVRRGFCTSNPNFHSVAWPATGLGAELRRSQRSDDVDLLHLHWLGDDTLSIEEIGLLSKPMVWTLHDQWAFCGAEHYTTPQIPCFDGSCNERFTEGYSPASRPAHETGPDLNRLTWLRKRRAWRHLGSGLIQVVCPSTWLGDCARRSALMGDWPITVIPYPLDLSVWAPYGRAHARALLGLPQDLPLVLFGAVGGTADYRKGADLLFEALQILRAQVACSPTDQLELIVFGQSQPPEPLDLGFHIHYFGRLQDDLSLRLLYAAADVMVVPSRQEAFGQTASEAQACGTPVVGFRTGGLVDIVEDFVTGALAEPFDPSSLAAAIRWVLLDPERSLRLGDAARLRATRLWDPHTVAGKYAEVYSSF